MRHVTRGDRGWLAGLFAGEGSVFVRRRSANRYRNEGFAYQVRIGNSDPRDVYKAANIINCIVTHKVTVTKDEVVWRTSGYYMFYVAVHAMSDIIKVLEAIRPDLAGKKDQVDLMLRHLKWRMAEYNAWSHAPTDRAVPDHILQKDRQVRDQLRVMQTSFRVRTDYTEPTH